MQTEAPDPLRLGQRVVRRKAARWWWAPLVAGIAWFLIAWMVLRADVRSLATVGVLVGVVLLIAAITEGGLAGIMHGGWRVLHVALAVFFALGALWAFIRPVNTFFALVSVLGLLLFLQGLLYVMRGIAMRGESPYWGIELGSGILIVLLGLWVSTSDRIWNLASRAAFVLLWVGFMAIVRGVSDIVLAFELHRLGREADVAEPGAAEPDDVGAPAPIPVQQPRPPAEAGGQARTHAR